MSKKLNKLKVFIVVFIFISMLTGSAILLYLIFNSSNPSLNSLLEQADSYIASGYFDSVKDILKDAYKSADGEYYHLKVLKRMYLTAKYTEDWDFLKEYALLSYDKMPGNKNIIHFAAYSSLRSGDISKTWEILTESGSTREFNNLWAEINLKYEGPKEELLDEDKPILSLLLENDPEIFIEYGVLNHEDRLIVDAALLYMIDGNPERALNALENLPEYRYYELKSFIAYDSGDIELASKILAERYEELLLNNRMDLITFLADMYLLNGQYEKAIELYGLVTDTSPDFEKNCYLNTAWILQKENRAREAYELLYNSSFFDDFRFIKELVLIDAGLGNLTEAEQLINNYLTEKPYDINGEILKLFLVKKTQNNYETGLWQLYEDYPDNEELCRYIVWYMINIGRNYDAELALDIYNSAKGGNYTAAWYSGARGIVQGLSGNINTALKNLGTSLVLEENYREQYNRAVLYLYDKKPYFALLELGKIKRDKIGNNSDLSMIYYLEAEICFTVNNVDKAIESCGKSLSLDPKNTKAVNLMRELRDL